MAEVAHVGAIDALAHFRNALIVYLAKARPALEDASEEVFRTREWLRTDRRAHWENQARQYARQLSDAQQALFSAELANLRAPTTAEKAAVQKAKAGLNLTEEKLRILKRTTLHFEREAQPQLNQLEHLRTLLGGQLPKAVHHLGELITRLEAYANISQVSAGPAGAQPNPSPEPGTGVDNPSQEGA